MNMMWSSRRHHDERTKSSKDLLAPATGGACLEGNKQPPLEKYFPAGQSHRYVLSYPVSYESPHTQQKMPPMVATQPLVMMEHYDESTHLQILAKTSGHFAAEKSTDPKLKEAANSRRETIFYGTSAAR